MNYIIEIYQTSVGKKPFERWFDKLKDVKVKALIFDRLDRIKLGNFGDTKCIGDGVSELRFHRSPGYRVYYAKSGIKIILLLCGGAKDTQPKDINLAKQYLLDFKSREI
jgi:putative addiction module killer protein